MKLAKKHIKRINDLLNGERVAYHSITLIDTSNTEKMALWARMGWENSQALYAEYGIQSCAGSLRYWNATKNYFVKDEA